MAHDTLIHDYELHSLANGQTRAVCACGYEAVRSGQIEAIDLIANHAADHEHIAHLTYFDAGALRPGRRGVAQTAGRDIVAL